MQRGLVKSSQENSTSMVKMYRAPMPSRMDTNMITTTMPLFSHATAVPAGDPRLSLSPCSYMYSKLYISGGISNRRRFHAPKSGRLVVLPEPYDQRINVR
jgi:hypothetical protein